MENPCYIRLLENLEIMLNKAIFVIISLLVAGGATCQTLSKGPEPEFVNTVTFVKDKTPIQLEKQKVQLKTNANASAYIVGIGKAKTIALVKGEKSNIRVPKADTIKFIVRVIDNSIDPSQVINFAKFVSNPDKKIRYIELSSSGTYSGIQSSDVTFVQFTASKYGQNSYLIEVANLDPGEYTITLEASRELAQMFGVDD